MDPALRPLPDAGTADLRRGDPACRRAGCGGVVSVGPAHAERLRRNNGDLADLWADVRRENRWRAQRYGVDEGLIDFGKGAMVPFGDSWRSFCRWWKKMRRRWDVR